MLGDWMNDKKKVVIGNYTKPDGTPFTLEMTVGQMGNVYNIAKSPEAMATFEAMGWSEAIITDIRDKMTSEQKQLFDWMMDYMAQKQPEVQRVYEADLNYPFPSYEIYWPWVRQKENQSIDAALSIKEDGLTLVDEHLLREGRPSHLKERVANTVPYNLNVDAFHLFSLYNARIAHYTAWALPIKKARAYFNNPRIKAAILENHGRAMYGQIQSAIADSARGAMDPAAVVRVLDKMRANFTASMLGLKPSIGLKQIPSILAYSTEIGLGDFLTGIEDFWHHPIENYKQMMDASPDTKRRFKAGHERDIRHMNSMKSMASRITGKANLRDWITLQIRMGDRLAIVQGQWAVYKAVKKEGKSDTEAWAFAEEVTNRTQPTAEMHTLSRIQRSGSFGRVLTMFVNQPNKYIRMEMTAWRNLMAGRMSFQQAAYNLFLVHVVLPVMFQFISDAFRPDKERLGRAALLGPINGVFILGQLMNSFYDKFQGSPFGWEPSPITDPFVEIGYGISGAGKLKRWADDPAKDVTWDDIMDVVDRFLVAGGELSGVPTPYAVQARKGISEGDWRQLFFSKYALTHGEDKKPKQVSLKDTKYADIARLS